MSRVKCWGLSLKAGTVDGQKPHTEDEVYFVLSGLAQFGAGAEKHAVGPGSLLFVERLVDHRFYDVTEDLTILVVFAPPEGSLKAAFSVEDANC
jgi:mannose-6-phosphate isomerase-like protein (cupin superfamily)